MHGIERSMYAEIDCAALGFGSRAAEARTERRKRSAEAAFTPLSYRCGGNGLLWKRGKAHGRQRHRENANAVQR